MELDEKVRQEIARARAWGLIEDGRRALASLSSEEHHETEAEHAQACREAAEKRAHELAVGELEKVK